MIDVFSKMRSLAFTNEFEVLSKSISTLLNAAIFRVSKKDRFEADMDDNFLSVKPKV